jgi:hypothetical protein
MMSAGGTAERFVGTTASECYDDGLVHNHAWATSGNAASAARAPACGMLSTMVFSWSPKVTQFHHNEHATVPAHERHDDGLVHNHEWAVSGK